MSDEHQPDETAEETRPSTYRYYNKNNGDVVERDRPQARLERLQNWVTVESDDHLDELRADNDRNGRGNLLGSSSVGDRREPRHRVPDSTFQPRVEFTEPSVNELRGNAPEAEDYRLDRQPQVITVDPSKQVEPIAGEGKRDLSAVKLDENLDLTPGTRAAVGSGHPEGVLARAHPELDGVEERRQQLTREQQESREVGDPDAGHRGESRDPRPAKSASKSDWIDYAVSQGADRTDAANMTKSDLIEVYGGGEGA